MANPYVNKVIVNGVTKLDLTGDTVDAAHLLSGRTAHDRSGAPVTGECTFDADTTDANAAAGDILSGKTAYVHGVKVTGTMANNGGTSGSISAKAQTVSIPAGYQDGSGSVGIAAAEQEKIIPANIKKYVSILGVTGNYEGSGGGGIPEPDPITAGDTPVYTIYETHVVTGTSAQTIYEYTAKKAGTYRVKASLTASNNGVTAQIRKNGTSQKSATWARAGSLSSSYYCDLIADVNLIEGDKITLYLSAGASSRGVVAHAMDICIDWENTF